MRKLDIYDKSYRFCDELFEMEAANETASDGSCKSNVNSNLTSDQLLEFTSAIISVVLAHHYQKDDIKRITKGTLVDFALVRDTMYRYSKKAEERFFGSACMAYFFYQFAKGNHGREYISSKLMRNTQ